LGTRERRLALAWWVRTEGVLRARHRWGLRMEEVGESRGLE
jgi:hypothetical protein